MSVPRDWQPELLGKPDTLRHHLTPTGRLKGRKGGGLGIGRVDSGVAVYVVGPLGWWHDFHVVPVGTSFDDAVRGTCLPWFHGWTDAEA